MATHKNAITTWGEIQVITSPQAYNIAGNYTPVKYTFQLVRTATSFGGYWSNNASTATLSINGTPITVPNFTYDFRTNYTKVLATGTINITHDPDGKKTFAISASTTTDGSLPNGSLSANETLTTIPRVSSIGTISGNQIGSPITVNITRASTSITHHVYYHLPGQDWQLVSTNATTSSTFTIPGSSVSFLPDAASGQLRIMIRTYSGGTQISGNITKYHTVHIPTSNFTVPSSFAMGSAFTVSIDRVAGQLTHRVYMLDGSLLLYDSGGGNQDSDVINVAIRDLAVRIPNNTSKNFRVQVNTYNGTAYVGVRSVEINAILPETVKPSFDNLAVYENVSDVATKVGAFVQNKSILDLGIGGASGIYDSGITSFNITGVGYSFNSSSGTTNILSMSGSHVITGTVTDSRGRSFSKTKTINILPYTPPKLTDLSIKRTDGNRVVAPLGTSVTVNSKVSASSLVVNGVEKNKVLYNVRSARVNGEYENKIFRDENVLTAEYDDVWGNYSADFGYTFLVRTGDIFGYTGWQVASVPTGVVTQQWASKTTSFGKMIDNTSFNIQVGTGGIQSDGDIIASGEVYGHSGNGVYGRLINNDDLTYVERFSSDSGGSFILNSVFGNVPMAGMLYVVEIGSPRFLTASFSKLASTELPNLQVLQSNGMTIGDRNTAGTVIINGALNNSNVRMKAVLEKIF